MSARRDTWSDEAVDQLVGRLLQVGVLVAAIVTLIGGVWLLAQHGAAVPDYRTFRGQPSHLTSIGGIVGGVLALRPDAVVQLGLVLLVATPVARVAFTLFAFARQRDRAYVVITATVLAILLYGLLWGRA